jgi:hypothetical protein
MHRGDRPYVLPPWGPEDSRTLLNWLSTRVTENGRAVHPDNRYERAAVERALRLAREHRLKVQAGVYIPRPDAPRGQTHRRKPHPRVA